MDRDVWRGELTVVLVDGELAVRRLFSDIVPRRVGTVSEAGYGKEALEVEHTHGGNPVPVELRYLLGGTCARNSTSFAGIGSGPALRPRTSMGACVATTAQDGVRPVLVLDEAHDLRPEVLDMLRILTNFDMDSRLVLSVILAGQPPLRAMLRSDKHESIAKRLTHIASLRLLTRDESNRYVAHRCTIAGAKTVPFDPTSLDGLHEIASGNLRATDQLAAKSLEIAHDAGVSVVDANHIVQARRMLCP